MGRLFLCNISTNILPSMPNHPWKLCQNEIKLLFFVRRVCVRRWEKISYFLSHRVGLLIDFLLGNGEHFLKVAMNGGLQDLVALEGPQLAEVDVYKRRCR